MLTLDLITEEDALTHGADGCDAFRVDLDKRLSQLSPECPRSKTDGALSVRTAEACGKSRSLPREVAVVWEQTGPAHTPQPGKPLTAAEKNRCASMDEILSHSEKTAVKNKDRGGGGGTAAPINRLQELINQKLETTERLLTEARGGSEGEGGGAKGKEAPEATRAEAERLLKEAAAAWNQARQVLEEVKELRELYQQLDPPSPPLSPPSRLTQDHRSPK